MWDARRSRTLEAKVLREQGTDRPGIVLVRERIKIKSKKIRTSKLSIQN